MEADNEFIAARGVYIQTEARLVERKAALRASHGVQIANVCKFNPENTQDLSHCKELFSPGVSPATRVKKPRPATDTQDLDGPLPPPKDVRARRFQPGVPSGW